MIQYPSDFAMRFSIHYFDIVKNPNRIKDLYVRFYFISYCFINITSYKRTIIEKLYLSLVSLACFITIRLIACSFDVIHKKT